MTDPQKLGAFLGAGVFLLQGPALSFPQSVLPAVLGAVCGFFVAKFIEGLKNDE